MRRNRQFYESREVVYRGLIRKMDGDRLKRRLVLVVKFRHPLPFAARVCATRLAQKGLDLGLVEANERNVKIGCAQLRDLDRKPVHIPLAIQRKLVVRE